MTYSLRFICFSFLLILIVSKRISLAQTPQVNEGFELYELVGEVDNQIRFQQSITDQPEIIQRHTIQINESIFQTDLFNEGDQLSFNLFTEDNIVAEITDLSTNISNTTSISSNVSDNREGHVIITYKDKRLFGTVHLYDSNRHFHIKSDSKYNIHYIEEIDSESIEKNVCGGVVLLNN